MSFDKLIKSGRKKPLFLAGPATQKVDLGRAALEKMVPHRDPFLLVDGIEQIDLEQGAIVARRRIDASDPVLAGHFPDYPVYPGVLLLEAMAQTAICLKQVIQNGRIEVHRDDKPLQIRLLKVHHALFSAEAKPGDDLAIVAKVVEDNDYTAILAGQVLKGDTICAFTIMEAYLLDE